MKEQENSPEELDGMEGSNLSDREFRVMIIRILNMHEKSHRSHKKGPVRNKEHNTEVNNTVEGINSRLDEAED